MKPLKIAFVCSAYYWDKKMSRGRFECVKAVGARSDIDLRYVGPGLNGFDGSVSVADNLKLMGFSPDVAWAYKPEDVIEFRKLKCLKVVAYNEAWWPDNRALNEVKEHKVDLVICHHHNDQERFKGFRGPVVHVPHGASPKFFFDKNMPKTEDRPVGFLLTGAIDKDIYPLRHSMEAAIRTCGLPGEVRRHPGYRLQASACESQYADYAAHLRRAKVSLCCTSKYKYLLAKIIESMMAGCIVATDAPDDPIFWKHLAKYCILIHAKATPTEVVERIAEVYPGLCGNCDREHERQLAGTTEVLENFSTEQYANRFVAAVRKALAS